MNKKVENQPKLRFPVRQRPGPRKRRTTQEKFTILDLMLGQIANYCPVISHNVFVNKLYIPETDLAVYKDYISASVIR